MASASDSSIQNQDGSQLNPISTLDSLAATGIPAERRAEVPRPSEQLNRLNNLPQLDKVADMAGPASGLRGAL